MKKYLSKMSRITCIVLIIILEMNQIFFVKAAESDNVTIEVVNESIQEEQTIAIMDESVPLTQEESFGVVETQASGEYETEEVQLESEEQAESSMELEETKTLEQSETELEEEKSAEENTNEEGNLIQINPLPEAVYNKVGETTEIKLECVGDSLTYRWYYSKDSGNTWSGCQYNGYRTPCLSFTVSSYQYNYMFRCLVTDQTGNTGWSTVVTLKKVPVSIISQPVDCYAVVGENTQFQVEVLGEGISYRWYYSKDSGSTWNTCQYSGFRTNNLSFECKEYQYGYLFRCVITDKGGESVTTKEVSLNPLPLTITQQPENVSVMTGVAASFHLSAIGLGLTYRWYYSKDKGAIWNPCQYTGYKTDTLSFDVLSYQYGYMFKCKVTDKNGNVIESDYAELTIPEIEIVEQPQESVCCLEDEAIFSIETRGYKQTYTWYYSKDEGINWSLCPFSGRRTSQLTIPEVKTEYDGYQFYCVASNYDGSSVTSNIVSLKVEEKKSFAQVFADDVFDSIQGENYETILDAKGFKENVNVDENDVITFSVSLSDATMQADNIVLVHFMAASEEKCGKLRVSVSGSSKFVGTYLLSTDMTEYILPITGFTNISDVKIALETEKQAIKLGNFEIVNYGVTNVGSIKTGLFNKSENTTEIALTEGTGFGTNATDIVTDGEYLYSVYRGDLIVYSLQQREQPQKVATLQGLGNSRDIAFCNDGKGLAVSARENGVYFVDITNPENPVLCSNIDSLELATGIASEGNYVFVCSRHFGVEIYDVSDLSNPKYCGNVSAAEEYYDCCVDSGYLYVSVWGQKKVHIYSLENVYHPVEVSTIKLNGAGGGCDVDNGILYVATGYHTTDERKTVTSPGYGYGNGLEIYDVTNPANPVWISGTKIDGRYFNSGFDHWRVTVENGYAYLAHTYNGAFIYDISNVYAPKRVEKITVNIPKTSSKYKTVNLGSYLYSYDPNEYLQEVVSDIAVGNGYLYLGSEGAGIYVSRFDYAQHQEKQTGSLVGGGRFEQKTDISILGYSVKQYSCEGTIYSIYEKDGFYYCAAGTAGILVYDGDMNLISQYKTAGVSKDIKVLNGYIYTAESDKGLGVYTFDGITLKNIARCQYNAYNTMFSYIDILPDEKHLCVQAGWTMCVFIDITNPATPYLSKTINSSARYKAESMSTMYYRNLSAGLIDGKYVGVFDRRNVTLFTSDEAGNVITDSKVVNSINSEANGVAAWENGAVAIYNNSYIYLNHDMICERELSSLPSVKIPGIKSLQGKASTNGNILVVSYIPGKQVTLIDISDINNPVLIKQFEVEGNPDIACISEDKILVPLRHGGILVIESVK